MKKNWWAVATIGMFVIVIVPLLIASGLSFRLINTDTTNEWIGFWGGYLGSLIGGAITLYVMKETNKDARENLEKTIQNEKELEKRGERLNFCNLLISKNSLLTENIEETAHRASIYVAYKENSKDEKQELEYLCSFSKQLRYTKAIILELYMHLEVKMDQADFIPEKTKELYELADKLHDELERFYEIIPKDDITSDKCLEKGKELYEMINVFGPKLNLYVKELLQK